MSENLVIWIVSIGVIGGLFAAWWFLVRGRKSKGGGYGTPPVPVPRDFRHQYTRPDGGLIATMHPIPEAEREAVLQTMTNGLQKCIDITQHHNPDWSRAANPRDFTLLFIDPMARNQDGSPALLVNGIQSAGTVLNVGYPDSMERGDPIIVLPDQGHPDYGWHWLPYLKAACWFEAEHVRAWLNNKSVFWYFTGPNDIHPNFPEPAMRLAAVLHVSAPCCLRPRAHEPIRVGR